MPPPTNKQTNKHVAEAYSLVNDLDQIPRGGFSFSEDKAQLESKESIKFKTIKFFGSPPSYLFSLWRYLKHSCSFTFPQYMTFPLKNIAVFVSVWPVKLGKGVHSNSVSLSLPDQETSKTSTLLSSNNITLVYSKQGGNNRSCKSHPFCKASVVIFGSPFSSWLQDLYSFLILSVALPDIARNKGLSCRKTGSGKEGPLSSKTGKCGPKNPRNSSHLRSHRTMKNISKII